MKRIYVLISLVLFTSLKIVFSQTCLPDGITFVLQQEIDEFTTNYPNCTEIEGNVTITGGWDLDSLYKITRIGGFLRILDNDEIDDFVGLNSLNSIGGYFEIFACEDLDDLSGLESLTSIGGDLEIVQNYNLLNFSGLDNLNGLSSLTSIGGHLYLKYNYFLNDITGLLGLTSIGNSGLWIQDNDDLTSLHGLDNIDHNTITDLKIISNSDLTECAIESVCGFLLNNTDFPIIHGNNSGCNSETEIEEECHFISIDENNSTNILIYPNPAEDIINISINGNYKIDQVSIYNTVGQSVFYSENISNNIDVSNLVKGIYVMEIVANRIITRSKLIIE